jgi:hypothetical protein
MSVSVVESDIAQGRGEEGGGNIARVSLAQHDFSILLVQCLSQRLSSSIQQIYS